METRDGLVVGVFGAWGSGKTSFLNMARPVFTEAEVLVLDFNPWLFSDAHQLMGRFFAELSAQLRGIAASSEGKTPLSEVARSLADYGGLIVDAVNLMTVLAGAPPVGRAASLFVRLAMRFDQRRRSGSVVESRKRVEQALQAHGRPIVVVLDDVDRLSRQEIREVFKLVRLTACFPNLVYVIVCDRGRIEHALTEDGASGRDYLEKIVQLQFDLPAAPRLAIRGQLANGLDPFIQAAKQKGGLFDENGWADILLHVIDPLIRTMRDVRRYVAAFQTTVILLGDEVEIVDVLALEAVRVFLPDKFARLHQLIDALTYPAWSRREERDALLTERGGARGANPTLAREVEVWVGDGYPQSAVIRALIQVLFPHGVEYLDVDNSRTVLGSERPDGKDVTSRRVSHESMLRRYLEGVRGYDLAISDEVNAWLECMKERDALSARLDTLDESRKADVLIGLSKRLDEISVAHESGLPVLLNRLLELPKTRPASVSPRVAVMRLVHRVLTLFVDAAAVNEVVEAMLPTLDTFDAKIALVQLVGHREGIGGQQLVTSEDADRLERDLASQIDAAMRSGAIQDTDLAWVITFPARVNRPLAISDEPEFTFRILKSAIQSDGALNLAGDLGPSFFRLLYGDTNRARSALEKLLDGWPAVWRDHAGSASEAVATRIQRLAERTLRDTSGGANDC